MPTQIRFPIVQRHALEHLAGGSEKFRLLYVNIARFQQVDVLEIIAPIPIGRQVLELAQRHFVVIFLRIAQLDLCTGGFRELRLERENFPGVFRGGPGRFTEERQHFCDMLDILGPQLFRGLVGFGIVITIR